MTIVPAPGAVFYHGGLPGLARIEPRCKTGAVAYLGFEHAGWRKFFFSPYRVYVTTERRSAEFYALTRALKTRAEAGTVYIVRPGADLDVDIDEPAAWSCDSAEVIAVGGTVPIPWTDPEGLRRLRDRITSHEQWLSEQPRGLCGQFGVQTDRDLLAFVERTVRRGARHGWNEREAAAILAEARARAAAVTRA